MRKARHNPLVACACGCGEMRPQRNSDGVVRRYINGHARRGCTWTPQRVDMLREAYPTWEWDDLITLFRVSKSALWCVAARYGIGRAPDMGGWRSWSDLEMAVLRGRWPDSQAMVDALPGRGLWAIQQKGLKMGLKLVAAPVTSRKAPAVVGEGLTRKLLENDVYAMIDKVVPRTLPREVRDAVISDMFMAYLDGTLLPAQFAAGQKKFLTAHNREFGGYRDISLDAVVPGTENLRRIDMLVDDGWRDEFDRIEERT